MRGALLEVSVSPHCVPVEHLIEYHFYGIPRKTLLNSYRLESSKESARCGKRILEELTWWRARTASAAHSLEETLRKSHRSP